MRWLRSLVAVAVALVWTAGCREDDHCDGNVAVSCGTNEWGSHRCTREDCGEEFCVEPELGFAEVQCAPERTTRPECQDEELHALTSGYWTCVESEIFFCMGGYLFDTTGCGAPELCHVGFDFRGDRNVHCILSATQDPRCLPLPDRSYFGGVMPICDGAVALGCFDGYLTTMTDCAATGGRCEDGHCRQ